MQQSSFYEDHMATWQEISYSGGGSEVGCEGLQQQFREEILVA